MRLFRIFLVLIFLAQLSSCKSNSSEEGEVTLGRLFVSSNTTAIVGVIDVSDFSNLETASFGIIATDADGIYYSSSQDLIVQANRTNNRVDVYTDISLSEIDANLVIGASSTSDFSNGRKIAVTGNTAVVAQDASDTNNQTNAFAVYSFSSSSVTLSKLLPTSINLWDIQFVGSDLYAIVDNSDSLAVFTGFLSQDVDLITPSKTVSIAGIVRTHALFYDSESDIMFMTDIGDAGSDSDGAIHIIRDFSSKFSSASNGGEIALSSQIRIGGTNTELGNPVGVTYDADEEVIYVAERASGGGKVLAFGLPSANGNPVPEFSMNYSGASAVYLAPNQN